MTARSTTKVGLSEVGATSREGSVVRLDFHARVQTGNIFWSNLDRETCCVSRSGRRSALFVAQQKYFYY